MWNTYLLIALLCLTPLSPFNWLRRRNQILSANEADFAAMGKLNDSIFNVSDPFAVEEGVAEPVLEGEWRPVDKMLAVNHKTYSMFTRGDSVPDFAQLGGIVWFTNGERTIEVHLYNESQVRHFVANAVEQIVEAEGPTNRTTHVGRALANYRFFQNGIRPRPVLSSMINDLDKPAAAREPVRIQAVEAADGIFIATSLARKGETEGIQQQLVIPTGFIRRAIGAINGLTDAGLEAPRPANLLAA